MKNPSHKAHGFTLIELMVTLAVTVVVLVLGIPAFQTLNNNSARTTRLNEMVGSLQLARNEAVKNGDSVSICRREKDSTTACAGSACDDSTGNYCWQEGWLIFTDANDDGALDAGETIIKVIARENPGYRITPSASFINSVTYDASGAVNSAGTFTFCDSRGAGEARAVIVGATGRPRISTDDIGTDGIHEDDNGTALTCS